MKKKNKIILMIISAMLCISILLQYPMSALATEETKGTVSSDKAGETVSGQDLLTADDTAMSREELIANVLNTNPEDAGEPNRVRPEHSDTAYTKDTMFTSTTLHGIFSSSELFFSIPDYWETEYIYVELQYNVSELIRSVASSMTFSINNIPIESCRVSYEDGNTQTVYVEIPMNLVKEGYNSFAISAYARLYDEEGCIDDFSGANWVSISDTSYIRSGYNIKDAEHKISYYPYPFMSTTEETGKGLSIAVSDAATDGEVAAAMNIMADLSTETGKENNIQFCLLSDLAATKPDRTVLIANYKNLTDEYKGKLSDTSGLSDKAVVEFVDDANGNPLLLVTSENDDCLLEAAYMLMDEARVTQEKASRAVVNAGSAEIAVNSTALSQMVAGNYKIGDIIGSGMTFVGPFHQEQNVYLPFSEDYFLSDAGKVTLNFRYSDNLDFNRSLVTVYWGNIPVASKKLEKSKTTGDELTFSMPADVVGTTAGSIRIAFDLEIRDLICTPRQEEMPWAYVSEESTLFLPASTGIVLTFDLKPSPFRTDGKFNDLMLVIPDKPTTNDLNLYAQIVGMYGDGVNPYGTFFVKKDSEFTEADSDYNIITVGTFKNSKLIQTINDKLYFQYNSTGAKFNSNEQLILSDNYAGKIGILQLLESPFAGNRGVLAVTGANEDILTKIEGFMRNGEKRLSLSKDCVIVDPDLDTKMYQFISKIEEVKDPTLLGTLTQNKKTLLFSVMSTSIMLMLLIAVAIILIRIRMYRRRNDEQ